MMSLQDRDLCVVVLDSNEQSRPFLVSLLMSLGVRRIEAFSDPEDALAWMEEQGRPDVLIVDRDLVPIDGVALVRYLRTVVETRTRYVPVILIGARAGREDLLLARNAGVNEVLAKPVSAAGLSARLVAVLDAPRPFIRTGDYFGPDRRRRQVPFSGPNRRQTADRGPSST